MDGRTDILLTPSYAHDPSVVGVAAATTDHSPGSFASTGAPPTKGLVHGLFMAPRPISAGDVAQARVVKPRAPLSKLPNATVAKADVQKEEQNGGRLL
ncbi:hypothetical protein D1007_44439 [Hordeum vulgare]|nr:hypothetical protein D1007_44439 [Hordeum vulgare]